MSKTKTPAMPRRYATLETWNPTGRVQRILKRRYLPFTGDVAALCASAVKLNPEGNPLNIMLAFPIPFGKIPGRVVIHFGVDAKGTGTSINIRLEAADVRAVRDYLEHHGGRIAGCMTCEYPRVDASDDDGGEELPLVLASATELSTMPTPSGVAH